jgi:hypothetical protein
MMTCLKGLNINTCLVRRNMIGIAGICAGPDNVDDNAV